MRCDKLQAMEFARAQKSTEHLLEGKPQCKPVRSLSTAAGSISIVCPCSLLLVRCIYLLHDNTSAIRCNGPMHDVLKGASQQLGRFTSPPHLYWHMSMPPTLGQGRSNPYNKGTFAAVVLCRRICLCSCPHLYWHMSMSPTRARSSPNTHQPAGSRSAK